METKKRMKNSKCYYPCLTLRKVRPWKPMTALLMELCQIMKANHQSFNNKFPKLFCLKNLRSCFLDAAVSGILQWNEPVAKKVTQARKGLDINSVSLATEFSLVSFLLLILKLLQKMIPKKIANQDQVEPVIKAGLCCLSCGYVPKWKTHEWTLW